MSALLPVTFETPVPFGKYRGRPLAEMMADASYVQWITAQAGIVERYPYIIEAIKHGSAQPEQDITPEHNAMQLRLLDDAVCADLVRAADKRTLGLRLEFELRLFEFRNWDLWIGVRGFDEVAHVYEHVLGIELKPQIGDDYPAVLRKVLGRRTDGQSRGWDRGLKVVVADSLNSIVATNTQIKQLYAHSGVTLLEWSEITKQSGGA